MKNLLLKNWDNMEYLSIFSGIRTTGEKFKNYGKEKSV
jgi:hypothetical protein